jgi:tRNA pseudouridine38-40 synthase
MPIALLLAYDGTDFHGYQRQGAGREPTLQGALERALERLCGADVTTTAAGRTDAGVHAEGQVVTFMPPNPERFALTDWQRALNALLPTSMAVRAVANVPEGMNARRSALARIYRYRVLLATVRDPLRQRFTHRVAWPLDLVAMQMACRMFLGEHDFAAFGHSPSDQAGQPKRSTVRVMHRAEVRQHADELWCEFAANAFLTGMVRRLMGTLLLVGAGRLRPADVTTILAARQGDHPGGAAPPNGLCLMQVDYPPGTIAWPAENIVK